MEQLKPTVYTETAYYFFYHNCRFRYRLCVITPAIRDLMWRRGASQSQHMMLCTGFTFVNLCVKQFNSHTVVLDLHANRALWLRQRDLITKCLEFYFILLPHDAMHTAYIILSQGVCL